MSYGVNGSTDRLFDLPRTRIATTRLVVTIGNVIVSSAGYPFNEL